MSSIYLRPLTEGDFNDSYLAWFRDPHVTRFLDARSISRTDAIDHLQRGRVASAWQLHAICLMADDRHIGNLKIGPVHWGHMISDLVTVIGERDAWGRGYAREAIKLGVDIAFGKLNIRKLSASIDSRNLGSIKAYTAAGFHIETILKDQFMDTSTSPPLLSDKVFVACFNPKFQPSVN